MAQTFLQALVSYFHSHNVLKSVFRVGADGNPWVDGASPPGELYSSLPLVTIDEYSEPTDPTFERSYIARPTFTITVFAEGLVTTEARALDVIHAFDVIEEEPQLLPIEGRRCTKLLRTNYLVAREEIRKPGCDWVYHVRMPYECAMRRELVNG